MKLAKGASQLSIWIPTLATLRSGGGGGRSGAGYSDDFLRNLHGILSDKVFNSTSTMTSALPLLVADPGSTGLKMMQLQGHSDGRTCSEVIIMIRERGIAAATVPLSYPSQCLHSQRPQDPLSLMDPNCPEYFAQFSLCNTISQNYFYLLLSEIFCHCIHESLICFG